MSAFLVFNELSCPSPALERIAAKRCLDDFSEILTDGRIPGRKVFVAPAGFPQLQVGAGYSVGRWLAEYNPGDREKRLRVKTLIDRRIEYNDCVSSEPLESNDVDYTFANAPAHGLATALLSDGLAISLLCANHWDTARIRIEKSWIEQGDVSTRTLDVLHACRTAHLEAHADWLRRMQTPAPSNGRELWSQRATLFPALDFCDSVEPQIMDLGGDGRRFRAVLRGLHDLQAYCESWTEDAFDIHRLNNASGESGPTLEMYGEERTFRCPDGQPRLFEWHVKRGDGTRIHFFEFPAAKRILVGYAGPHLRTKNNP